MKLKAMISRILPTRKWKVVSIVLLGIIGGGGMLFLYMPRAHTYLGEPPPRA